MVFLHCSARASVRIWWWWWCFFNTLRLVLGFGGSGGGGVSFNTLARYSSNSNGLLFLSEMIQMSNCWEWWCFFIALLRLALGFGGSGSGGVSSIIC